MSMFPAPDSDRARLEAIVVKNCIHNQSGWDHSLTCTRTDDSAIAKCGAHELLKGYSANVPQGISRQEAEAWKQTHGISWCSVLSFYKWLLERENGAAIGRREYHLSDAAPQEPAALPSPEPAVSTYGHDANEGWDYFGE